MKTIMLILLSCGLATSCTSVAMREFQITGADNEAAWSRAHVAVFEEWGYSFFTNNEHIIRVRYADLSVTRMNMGGNRFNYKITHLYRTRLLQSRDQKVRASVARLEYRIRNVEPPRTEHSETYTKPVDQPVIKAPSDRPAKKKEVRPGVFVWE